MPGTDWELVENPKSKQSEPQPQAQSASDWEMAPVAPNSRQPQANEPLAVAAMKAPFRMGEDVLGGVYNLAKNAPEYYQQAKTEIPGMFDTAKKHPGHWLSQLSAGLPELGQNAFNLPHDVANYAANRLNLLPQNVNEKIQMGRMPDRSKDINAVFGEPKYPGEKLGRGLVRNFPLAAQGTATAAALNPLKMTLGAISRDVVNETQHQVARHGRMYGNLWESADRQGFNNVPHDPNLLTANRNFIATQKTPKQYQTLTDFIHHPTLNNAQRAQSDLRQIERSLDETAKTRSLTGEERNLHDSVVRSREHIHNGMFRNASGDLNQRLLNRYNNISHSYAENVVPYRYNKAIQDFMDRQITSKELVDALGKGEFAVKKGAFHPEISRRANLKDALMKTGAAGGILGGGLLGYNYLTGNK